MKNGLMAEVGVWAFLVILKESISESIQRHGVYGSIESPGFPDNYPNQADIQWETFGPIDAISMTVIIQHFDLYHVPGSQCSDNLMITEVENNFTFFNRCGTLPETKYLVLGNKMVFTFKTDGENTAKGFKIYWEVRDYKEKGKDPIVKVRYCPESAFTSGSPLSTETSAENITTGEEEVSQCPTSTTSFVKDGVIGVLALALAVTTAAFFRQRSSTKRKIDYTVINRSSSEFPQLENETEPVYDHPFVLTGEIENYLRSTTSSGYAIPGLWPPGGYDPPIYGNISMGSSSHSYIDVEVSDESEQGPLYLNKPNPQRTRERDGLLRYKKDNKRKLRDNDYLNCAPKLHSYIEVLGDGTLPMTSPGCSNPMENTIQQLIAIIENQTRGTTRIVTH